MADQAVFLAVDLALIGVLLYASLYDLRHLILPDEANLALAVLGFVSVALTGQPTLLDAGLGTVIGGGALLAARFLFRAMRGKEGLGLGDVKLLGAGGIWIGSAGIGPALLIATFAGALAFALRALHARRFDPTEAMPFGPFLSFGIAVVHFMVRFGY